MSERDDQAATLRAQAPVIALHEERSRMIAITGGKGGVGKSTIAVNLAVAYGRQRGRVLALDGDAGMADLNILLGVAPERSLLDVVRGVPADEVIVEAHGIHLMPALNGSYALANLDDIARRRIFDSVATLGRRFDTLVIDTPAGLGQNAVAFAGVAAEVIVVATPEPLSLADAYACMKVLRTRAGLQRALVIPNGVRTQEEADDVVERLRNLNDRFLGVELEELPAIPFDPAVRAAAAAGVPLVLHAPESPAARALVKIARRIDALSSPVSVGVGGFIGKWMRALGGDPQPGEAE
jgi:flagellar biosynthesis protein FlhG